MPRCHACTFRHRVCRGAREHGNAEESRSHEAEREEKRSGLSGHRLERLRRLGRGLHVGEPVRVQGRARRQDDEVHDEVRDEHSRHDIRPRAAQLALEGAARPIAQLVIQRLVRLDLLRRLPEKEIRTDSRPEDGDEGKEIVLRERDLRKQRPLQHVAPVRLREERRDDVCEEYERQPLEDPEEHRVRAEHEKEQNDAGEHRHEVAALDVVSISAPAAIPERSAAILIVFPTNSRMHANQSSQGG